MSNDDFYLGVELCTLLRDMYLIMSKVAREGNTWESAFARLMAYRIAKIADKMCKKKEGHE